MKTSSRLLDQDEHSRFSHACSEDVFKTSSRRLDQNQYIRLGHTFSRRLQEVFKTSSGRLQDVLPRRLQDLLERYLQDVFKTYHQIKIFLLRSLRDVFSKFLRRTAKTVIYRNICLRSHFWEVYGQCAKFAWVIKISQVLVFHFTTPFSGCLHGRI